MGRHEIGRLQDTSRGGFNRTNVNYLCQKTKSGRLTKTRPENYLSNFYHHPTFPRTRTRARLTCTLWRCILGHPDAFASPCLDLSEFFRIGDALSPIAASQGSLANLLRCMPAYLHFSLTALRLQGLTAWKENLLTCLIAYPLARLSTCLIGCLAAYLHVCISA